jgi:hypothetical protein
MVGTVRGGAVSNGLTSEIIYPTFQLSYKIIEALIDKKEKSNLAILPTNPKKRRTK